MKIDLPLTVEKQQELSDGANPFSVPPLIDAVVTLQDALTGIRDRANGCRTERDRVEFVAYVKQLVGRILPE